MPTTNAKWDPPAPLSVKVLCAMPRSARRGYVVGFSTKPIMVPPSVPARKKNGKPDIGARFTRALETHFAEKRRAPAEQAQKAA